MFKGGAGRSFGLPGRCPSRRDVAEKSGGWRDTIISDFDTEAAGYPVDLRDKLDGFSERWSPRIVATLNDDDVMVVRVEGEFVWHAHPETDDFFLVLEGELDIDLRDRTVTLRPGELFVVLKGVEHRPAARGGEVRMMLIEPQGTPNTGDERTATANVRI